MHIRMYMYMYTHILYICICIGGRHNSRSFTKVWEVAPESIQDRPQVCKSFIIITYRAKIILLVGHSVYVHVPASLPPSLPLQPACPISVWRSTAGFFFDRGGKQCVGASLPPNENCNWGTWARICWFRCDTRHFQTVKPTKHSLTFSLNLKKKIKLINIAELIQKHESNTDKDTTHTKKKRKQTSIQCTLERLKRG